MTASIYPAHNTSIEWSCMARLDSSYAKPGYSVMSLVDFLTDDNADFDLMDCGSGSRLCRAVSHRAAQSLADDLTAFGLQRSAVIVLVGSNTVGPH